MPKYSPALTTKVKDMVIEDRLVNRTKAGFHDIFESGDGYYPMTYQGIIFEKTGDGIVTFNFYNKVINYNNRNKYREISINVTDTPEKRLETVFRLIHVTASYPKNMITAFMDLSVEMGYEELDRIYKEPK